jgi:SAM-dependent methyltransferase
MTLLYVLLIFLLAYFIFAVAQFYNVVFRGYAPFVSTDYETFRRIIAEIEIKDGAVVYELGCGRARFLRLIEKKFPKTELIGIENLVSLYFFTELGRELRGSKINILKKDFFKLDLSDADIVYCYLNNATMKKLGEKFKNECKAGTQIISRSFPIPDFTAEKVLIIRYKKVYFYKI